MSVKSNELLRWLGWRENQALVIFWILTWALVLIVMTLNARSQLDDRSALGWGLLRADAYQEAQAFFSDNPFWFGRDHEAGTLARLALMAPGISRPVVRDEFVRLLAGVSEDEVNKGMVTYLRALVEVPAFCQTTDEREAGNHLLNLEKGLREAVVIDSELSAAQLAMAQLSVSPCNAAMGLAVRGSQSGVCLSMPRTAPSLLQNTFRCRA